MALSLAKHLVAAWRWNIKVRCNDDCPPAPSVLNIGQFITDEEAAVGMGKPHWFMAYSHALQQVGEVACGRKWEWPRRDALEIKAFPLVHAFLVQDWHGPNSGQHKTLLGANPKGTVPPERQWPHHSHHL